MSPARPQTALCLRELSGVGDALAGFEALRGLPHAWLLDSALLREGLGRFSFAGADPYLIVRVFGSRVELDVRRAVRPDLSPGREIVLHDPLDVLRSLMPPPPAGEPAPGIPFAGGVVGCFGYELAEQIEPVAFRGRDDLGFPDATLFFVDRLLAIDHVADRAAAIGLGFGADRAEAETRAQLAADALRERIGGGLSGRRARDPRTLPDSSAREALLTRALPASLEAAFDESAYAKSVVRILDEIAAGNVYQANLTQRFELPLPSGVEPWSLYRTLRSVNPAPFGAYLELHEGAVLGSSPERFLRVGADRSVESRPIKGTRPRGRTPEEDARLARELASSEKDRAENLMIVDLVRNDLGRVCETGSVAVPELMTLERYASVFQLVSSVTGRLRADRDVFDLLRAAFPPGSMTGAPKIAAMRLLDRLEPVRRGIYSGAVGYLDVRGGADLAVVIRTLLVSGDRVCLHAGGGIVADSDPAAEYAETLDKLRALVAAVIQARRA